MQEPSNLVPEVKRVGRCALSFDLSGCSRFFVSDIRGFLRVTGVSFLISGFFFPEIGFLRVTGVSFLISSFFFPRGVSSNIYISER